MKTPAFNAAFRSLSTFSFALSSIIGLAQSVPNCSPPSVIPLTTKEPAAKILINPPLAEPLASRGVVVIPYCAQNVHIAPVFGPNAVTVSPRVGHIHVRVDDAAWIWADASGTPIILQGLPPGTHKVTIELVDANHGSLVN